VQHAVTTFAPLLAITSANLPTITPSTFVVPHCAFTDPTTASEMIKDVAKYELQDWAVWNGSKGPTFYFYPRGSVGKRWRARVGPTQLSETGPQIDRLWNGVIVQFTDVAGITWTVGPPDSGAKTTDTRLRDYSSSNPCNAVAGLKRYAMIQMGTSVWDIAVVVGQVFLTYQKLLDTSGQATLTGHVLDDKGVLWPAWMVRAGDYISFIDAHDTSLRRIVKTDYSADTYTNSISLDTPPDGLQELLDRLGVGMMGTGFS
jgi:hypothetical protein